MKAKLEKIEPGFGSSFTLRAFHRKDLFYSPFWHFHPEYEIVYISSGKGKRHIGNHISYYENGDLIFLGPNLPHFGFNEELAGEHLEIVLQMKEDFLGRDFFSRPEMIQIQKLFERSRQGLSFSQQIKESVGGKLKEMLELSGFERLLALLDLLHSLSLTEDYKVLNARNFSFEVNSQDYPRIQSVYDYVASSFKDQITLDDIAKRVNMTPPAFSRYFKKLTGKTFIQFVNEYRIAHASKHLVEEDKSISEISFDSGFNNISHFNKQFKLITGVTPRMYRKNLKKTVGGEDLLEGEDVIDANDSKDV